MSERSRRQDRATKPISLSRWVPRLELLESRDTPSGIYAAAVAPGSAPVVTVYDAATQQQKFTVTAFDGTFTGGVNVAVADVNGDGTPDVIAGAGPGGGPDVQVFSGVDGSRLASFTVGDTTSRAGVSVAAGDFEGTGTADVVVGTMQGGEPLVEILRFADQSVVKSFTPFSGAAGVSVAVGDTNQDGTPDVVAGSGGGLASSVLVFSGTDGSQLQSFAPFEATFTGGVTVATGDLDGDGSGDVIVSAGAGGGPRVEALSGASGAVVQNFFAYDSTERNGVLATAFDSSGTVSLVTADGPGSSATPLAFDPQTLTQLTAPTVPYLPAGTAYDGAAPTATVSSTASSPTNAAAIPVTVTFSKPVVGFSAAGVSVTNGTASRFAATSATVYTFTVTPAADGTVTVSVPAAGATDAAGAGNAASNAFTITSTRTAPSVAVTSTATDPTSTDPIPVTVTFSESVTGFSVNGLTVTNGSVSGFTAVSDTTYTFDVAPVADGPVTVSVPAASATDAAGNPNTASPTFSVNSVRTAPTVAVSTTAGSPTNADAIPVTVKFSESVTGFTAAGVTVANGTLSGFAGDGATYTFTVTPSGDGPVSVSVTSGVGTDAAGNQNAASNILSVVSDLTPPTVAVDAAPTSSGVVTGTAADATTGIASVAVSISDGTNYWDGSGFNSPTQQFLPATTADDWKDWTYAFTGGPGMYTVQAQATDGAENTAVGSAQVTTA